MKTNLLAAAVVAGALTLGGLLWADSQGYNWRKPKMTELEQCKHDLKRLGDKMGLAEKQKAEREVNLKKMDLGECVALTALGAGFLKARRDMVSEALGKAE